MLALYTPEEGTFAGEERVVEVKEPTSDSIFVYFFDLLTGDLVGNLERYKANRFLVPMSEMEVIAWMAK